MVVGGVLSIYITFNGMKSGKVEYKFEVGTTGGFAELRRFTVEGNSITDDSNTQVKGMYNDDGIISWYEGSNLVATWKRNGIHFQILTNNILLKSYFGYLF